MSITVGVAQAAGGKTLDTVEIALFIAAVSAEGLIAPVPIRHRRIAMMFIPIIRRFRQHRRSAMRGAVKNGVVGRERDFVSDIRKRERTAHPAGGYCEHRKNSCDQADHYPELLSS